MARKVRLQKTAAHTAHTTDRIRRTRNGDELRTARRKFLMGESFNTIRRNGASPTTLLGRFRQSDQNRYGECAAAPDFALERYVAAQEFRQFPHNRETQAAPFVLARHRIGRLSKL